jgi:hypothetical protein
MNINCNNQIDRGNLNNAFCRNVENRSGRLPRRRRAAEPSAAAGGQPQQYRRDADCARSSRYSPGAPTARR